jgi:hypothetical protein
MRKDRPKGRFNGGHRISNDHRQRAARASHLALTMSRQPVTLPTLQWLDRASEASPDEPVKQDPGHEAP